MRVLLPAPAWPTKETRLGVRRASVVGEFGEFGETLSAIDCRLNADGRAVVAIISAYRPWSWKNRGVSSPPSLLTPCITVFSTNKNRKTKYCETHRTKRYLHLLLALSQ